MPTDITRDEVRDLLGLGAQLVEVPPREGHAEEHRPGAMSIPLEEPDARPAREPHEHAEAAGKGGA